MTRNVLEYLGLRETERTNRAKEEETHRANLAKEAETYRYNQASIAEQIRHNQETESQNRSALAEAARANRANESIGWFNAGSTRSQAETAARVADIRQLEANTAAAKQKAEYDINLRKQNEEVRHNQQMEKETQRHNMAAEIISRESNEYTKTHYENQDLKGGFDTLANILKTTSLFFLY